MAPDPSNPTDVGERVVLIDANDSIRRELVEFIGDLDVDESAAFNHIHFWRWMKPNGGGKIPGEVEKALKDSFGSVAGPGRVRTKPLAADRGARNSSDG